MIKNDQKKEIRYIDLFGGVGGFRLGIERAVGNRKPGELAFNCVFYCEIDKYCVQVYNNQFQERYEPKDISAVRAEELPDFDLLCAGFPCQAFSIAGKRKGFQDSRGTLFFEIARILEIKRPRFVFLENVKGLLNHNKGETFKVILQTLSKLGHELQWMVLNSKFFGVPQNRERVFIIGSLGGEPRPEILPFRTSNKINNEKCSEQVARTLSAQYYKQGQWEQYIMRKQFDISGKGYKSQQDRIYHPNGVMCCLPNSNPTNKLNIFDEKEPKVMIHRGVLRKGKYGNGLKEGMSFTLDRTCGRDLTVKENIKIRRLTPIECERLQGFPANWTQGVSDTQRYKMMGNVVTVNVIKAISGKLLNLDKTERGGD